jgi:uncharacterized Zn finger protein
MKKCPKCGSSNVEEVLYSGTTLILCNECGYDERDEYDVVPEEKTSQKAKGRYSPYKTGGKRRSSKK